MPRTLVLVACFTCLHALAQSQPQGAPVPTNAPPAAPGVSLTSPQSPRRVDLSVPSKQQPGNQGQQPAKKKSIWRFPLRLAKDLNPLAPIDPKAPAPVPRTGGPAEGVGENRAKGNLSPRAWTTTVGWHPGQSAFPDPITAWP